MRYVVVDTDVFSQLYRGTNVERYRHHPTDAIPVLCFASVAELYFGAAKSNWGEKKLQGPEEAVRRYVISPYDENLARL